MVRKSFYVRYETTCQLKKEPNGLFFDSSSIMAFSLILFRHLILCEIGADEEEGNRQAPADQTDEVE